MNAKHSLKAFLFGMLFCGHVLAESIVIDDKVSFVKDAYIKSAVKI